jgi:hypothetical protein
MCFADYQPSVCAQRALHAGMAVLTFSKTTVTTTTTKTKGG